MNFNLKKFLCFCLSIMVLVLSPALAAAEGNPISIDCYFDDWGDKPMTQVGNDTGSVFSDGQNLYMYIKLNGIPGQDVPNTPMTLSVNNQYKVKFVIRTKNADNSMGDHINQLPQGSNLNLGVFDNYSTNYWLGDAAINLSDNKSSETEFFINLEAIRQFCDNIPVSEMQTLSFSSPDLGNREITVTGTSTSPYIGLVVVFAALAIILFLRKRKQTVK